MVWSLTLFYMLSLSQLRCYYNHIIPNDESVTITTTTLYFSFYIPLTFLSAVIAINPVAKRQSQLNTSP